MKTLVPMKETATAISPQPIRSNLSSVLRVLPKIALSTIALYVVFTSINANELITLLKHSKLTSLPPALASFVLSKVISAYRLNVFFRAASIFVSEATNLRLYWLGMFYNLFLPGGIGGDAYKVYFLHRNFYTPIKTAFTAIVLDRITGLLALLFLCFVFACVTPPLDSRMVVFLLLIALLGFALYFGVHRFFPIYSSALTQTNLLALATQISQAISAFFILQCLGNESHTLHYLLLFLVSSVVAVIPFTIGGVGAREITSLYAAKLLGIDVSVAVALSLLFFAITAFVSAAGGIYLFRNFSQRSTVE